MSDIGKYYVQIVPSAQGISGSIEKAMAPGAKTAGISSGQTIAQNIGGRLQKLGGGMMKAGAIATAVAVPIVAGIKSALDAYETQNAAETKLTEIYKTRMGATEQAAKATMDYASALQKEGIIGDEVMLSGAQQVATFAKMPDTVNTLLPAMNNLLAQQKGYNATSEDATNIANLMGKVLNGQVGALKRVGISFDENQEKILKTGTEEEKAAMLAQVITDNVGNMNETMAQTPLGKIQQMKNSFGDLKEQIGASLAPVLMQVADFISQKILPAIQKGIDFMQGNPIVSQVIVGITGVLAIGGPLLALIGSITSSIGALIPVIAGIGAPVIAIGAAIAAVVAILATAYARNEQFRSTVNGLAKTLASTFAPVLKSVKTFLATLVTEFKSVADAVATAMTPALKLLSPLLELIAKLIARRLSLAFSVLTVAVKLISKGITAAANVFAAFIEKISPVLKPAMAAIKKFSSTLKSNLTFSDVLNGIKRTFESIKDAIVKPFQPAINAIKGAINKIKGFFPLKLGKIFSGIKLPKFNISGGKAPWGIGGKGKEPSIDIDWRAKGGIVNEAQLIGVGEKGPEAILPLDPFWKKLDTLSAGRTLNANITINDASDPKQTADEVIWALEGYMRAGA